MITGSNGLVNAEAQRNTLPVEGPDGARQGQVLATWLTVGTQPGRLAWLTVGTQPGRLAGRPNLGRMPGSKRVMAQIWRPERVRTISPIV